MLIEDLQECLVELPLTGSSLAWSFSNVADDLTANGAYFVTEGSGRAQHIIGVVYGFRGKTYYVAHEDVYVGGNHTETKYLASQAQLVDEVWDGSNRARDFLAIKDKLRPIPTGDRAAVIDAISDALDRDHQRSPRAANLPAYRIA